MPDTSKEVYQTYCRMLRELPAEERLRMGFAYSEFTRRLLRQGLTAEGLPTDGVEFVRRLYGNDFVPEMIIELENRLPVDLDTRVVSVNGSPTTS